HMLLLLPILFSLTPPTTSAIYTLSLHDALPIYKKKDPCHPAAHGKSHHKGKNQHQRRADRRPDDHHISILHIGDICSHPCDQRRSEEHTSELQSRFDLVCRLLLEKKNKRIKRYK